MQKYLPFIMYYWSALLFTHKALLTNIITHKCKLGHQNLSVCEVSTRVLEIERNMEKTF